MTRIKVHFDGKVIVPHEPLDLPEGRELTLDLRIVDDAERNWMTGKEFVALVEQLDFPPEDLDEMEKAIEEGCEQIDHDGW